MGPAASGRYSSLAATGQRLVSRRFGGVLPGTLLDPERREEAVMVRYQPKSWEAEEVYVVVRQRYDGKGEAAQTALQGDSDESR